MVINRNILITLLTLCSFHTVKPQLAENKNSIWRDIIIQQFNESYNEHDLNSLLIYLSELENEPLNINKASKKDLETLPFLNFTQIENLHYYIFRYGELKSIEELILIDGYDKLLIDLLRSFLVVENNIDDVYKTDKTVNNNVNSKKTFIKNNLIINYKQGLYKNYGYVDKPDSLLLINPNLNYLGEPFYLSVKFNTELNKHIRIGFAAEKDKGEKLISRDYPYADYFSAFIEIKNTGIVNKLILGSYKLKTGAGLSVNNNYYMGKSSYVAGSLYNTPILRAHNSMDETNYFNGLAAQLNIKNRLLTVFWSIRDIDATIENNCILNFKTDGKHNTYSTLQKKGNVNNITTGLHLFQRGEYYKIGLLTMFTTFDKSITGQDVLYKKYQYTGRNCINLSVDYSFNFLRTVLTGETSYCDNNSFATVNMLNYYFSDSWTFNTIYRYYSKRYNSFHSKSFSEGGTVSNESGIFFQLLAKPFRNTQFSTYVDIFRFPYMRYGISSASSGYDGGMQGTVKVFNNVFIKAKYSIKKRDRNDTDTVSGSKVIIPAVKETYYINIYTDIKTGLTLGFNLINVCYNKKFEGADNYKLRSRGNALTGYIGVNKYDLRIMLSYTVFNTDDTYSKIYFSDRSGLNSLEIPSFYGDGVNMAIAVRYKINKKITADLKFNQTKYFDRDQIGTSLERIDSNIKNDISLQLKYKF